MGFLDVFSRSKPKPKHVAKPLSDAPDYPLPFALDGRFVNPDWEAVSSWAEANVPEDGQERFYDKLLLRWVSEFADRLDNGYTVYSTSRVLFMTESTDEDVEKTVRYADGLVERIPRELPGLPRAGVHAKCIFFQFEGREVYTNYAARYLGPGTVGESGGMAILSGYPHILLLPGMLSGLKATLAHELLHVHTCGLNMPRWLDEGLALRMESLSDEMVWKRGGMRRDGSCSRVWDAQTIQLFWTGQSFFVPGEMQEASYALAADLHDSLAVDGEAFQRFIGKANFGDAGDAACLECFGHTLGEVMKPLLGPGLWGVSTRDPVERDPAEVPVFECDQIEADGDPPSTVWEFPSLYNPGDGSISGGGGDKWGPAPPG